jgi:hypothetical protein
MTDENDYLSSDFQPEYGDLQHLVMGGGPAGRIAERPNGWHVRRLSWVRRGNHGSRMARGYRSSS